MMCKDISDLIFVFMCFIFKLMIKNEFFLHRTLKLTFFLDIMQRNTSLTVKILKSKISPNSEKKTKIRLRRSVGYDQSNVH